MSTTLGRIVRRTPVTLLIKNVPVNTTAKRGLCGGWYYGRHNINNWNHHQQFHNNMRNFWRNVSENMESVTKQAEKTLYTRSNVFEKADAYKIIVEMPGVPKEGVEIKIEDGRLLVKGRKPVEVEAEGETVEKKTTAENKFYSIEYDISQDQVVPAQVKAKLENGILEITLPKSTDKKAHVVTLE